MKKNSLKLNFFLSLKKFLSFCCFLEEKKSSHFERSVLSPRERERKRERMGRDISRRLSKVFIIALLQ